MQKFWRSAMSVGAILLSLCMMVFLFLLLHAPAFEEGEDYTLYLGANSSARAVVTNCPLRDKLLLSGVKGESVRYEGDRYLELADKFQAKLLFVEEFCSGKNYYLFSPCLGGGISLNGETVNLQIAVGTEQTVVGTPLIFGGF